MEKTINRPKVKICGLTRIEDADFLNEAGADYAGFVFYEKSRRNVNLKKAAEIAAQLSAKSCGDGQSGICFCKRNRNTWF